MTLDNLITAPGDTRIDQGDIFEGVYFHATGLNLKGLLITPTCDLAKMLTEPDIVKLCALIDFDQLYPVITRRSRNDADREDVVSNLIGNRFERYHWLGKLPSIENKYWYIDLAITECVKYIDLKTENRIAMIKSPLRESVPTKYAAYMGRVGLPWEKPDWRNLAKEVVALYTKDGISQSPIVAVKQ